MENINENGTAAAGTEPGTEEKKFTQADVDAIVEGRLARQKQKYADYDDLKETARKYEQLKNSNKTDAEQNAERIAALEQQLAESAKEKTVEQVRNKVAQETGVPASLLTGEDEETCKKQAKAIKDFAKPTTYPGPRRNSKPHASEPHVDDGVRELVHQLFGGK